MYQVIYNIASFGLINIYQEHRCKYAEDRPIVCIQQYFEGCCAILVCLFTHNCLRNCTLLNILHGNLLFVELDCNKEQAREVAKTRNSARVLDCAGTISSFRERRRLINKKQTGLADIWAGKTQGDLKRIKEKTMRQDIPTGPTRIMNEAVAQVQE
jgi:hypothetical protein